MRDIGTGGARRSRRRFLVDGRCIAFAALCLAPIALGGCGSRTPVSLGKAPTEPGGSHDAGTAEVFDAGACTVEVCNRVDDDCDGRVDELVTRVFYEDVDGDAFGGDETVRACEEGPGLSTRPGDCDDLRGDLSPGLPEICDDAVDNDCDGASDCFDLECSCMPPMVAIDPGTFVMGSPEHEEGREEDEVQREVSLTRAFEIMPTEVTQREWRRLTGTSPAFFRDCDDCPVELVSFLEVLQFANLRSEEEGLTPCYTLAGCSGAFGEGCPGPDTSHELCVTSFECTSFEFVGLDCDGYRLPTEAEWEFAARAGRTDGFPIGDDLHRVPEIGWCSRNSERRTHPVAQLAPNPVGLYDMAGNVYEWVFDLYTIYDENPVIDPIELDAGSSMGRIRRGGAYDSANKWCRSANRGSLEPRWRWSLIGFRLVRTI